MSDTVRVDYESLRAARLKYRKAVVEAERLPASVKRDNLVHTLYKLGSFLDDALSGAFRAMDDRAPDTLPPGV
jgi:hypothetical protein